MRLLVPYTDLWPETREALDRSGLQPEYMNVAGSPTAYHDLLEQVWAEARGFMIVEHDIVPWPGALDELLACPEPWCVFAYSLSTTYDGYLGCVRFSTALVAANLGAVRAIQFLPHDGTPRRYWGRLDTRLEQVLRDQVGVTKHVHWPAVGHLNLNQQPPVYSAPCGHTIPDAVVRQGPDVRLAWRCPQESP